MFSTKHGLSTVATGAAAAGAAIVFVVLHVGGVDLVVGLPGGGGGRSVPLGAVVFATALGGLGAHILARLSARTSRPRRTFLIATGIGLVASSIPPVQAATTVSTMAWLLVLHVVVAAILLPPLARSLPPLASDRAATTPAAARDESGARP